MTLQILVPTRIGTTLRCAWDNTGRTVWQIRQVTRGEACTMTTATFGTQVLDGYPGSPSGRWSPAARTVGSVTLSAVGPLCLIAEAISSGQGGQSKVFSPIPTHGTPAVNGPTADEVALLYTPAEAA